MAKVTFETTETINSKTYFPGEIDLPEKEAQMIAEYRAKQNGAEIDESEEAPKKKGK